MAIIEFFTGGHVERTGSSEDYTTGRKGTIVEVDRDAERCRVLWEYDRGNNPLTPPVTRTWVHFRFLKLIAALPLPLPLPLPKN